MKKLVELYIGCILASQARSDVEILQVIQSSREIQSLSMIGSQLWKLLDLLAIQRNLIFTDVDGPFVAAINLELVRHTSNCVLSRILSHCGSHDEKAVEARSRLEVEDHTRSGLMFENLFMDRLSKIMFTYVVHCLLRDILGGHGGL